MVRVVEVAEVVEQEVVEVVAVVVAISFASVVTETDSAVLEEIAEDVVVETATLTAADDEAETVVPVTIGQLAASAQVPSSIKRGSEIAPQPFMVIRHGAGGAAPGAIPEYLTALKTP